MVKPEFKFYTHSGRAFKFSEKPKKLPVSRFIKEVVFGVCFSFGNVFYQAVLKCVRAAVRQWQNTASNLRRRAAIIRQPIFAKTLTIFLFVAACGYGTVFVFHFLAQGLEFKNHLVNLGQQGSEAILGARTDLQNKDFNAAQNKFQLALSSFSTGQKQLNNENQLLNDLFNLLPQKQDADKLFTAATRLADAGEKFTKIYATVSQWQISPAGISTEGQEGVDLEGTQSRLNEVLAEVDQAGDLLDTVNANLLPAAYKEKLLLIKDNFASIKLAFHSLQDLLSLSFDFVSGDKQLLLVLENNNELRPTGGFIGTYGAVKIHEGSIKSIDISSIYDLDGQLAEKIQPPFPVLAVNDRWFMRDSNWFADFPQTAKKISDFYEKEGGQTPDEILALTPGLIQNMLKLTGPITLPKYGVTLTQDNFVEVTQVESSVNYSRVDNKPKQILADLVPVLLSRLGSLPKEQFPQLLQIIQDSLNQKQLVLYSRDSESESRINSFNWGGGVLSTDRDYLSVVGANLNGSKTDLYLKQNISLTTSIDSGGGITDELTITRTNTMPDLPDTANSSFIRVFVPQGSQLVSNMGFDFSTSVPVNEPGYLTDPDVAAWEKTVVKDLVTGTSIGSEAGKTFFGNWLTVRGGQTKTVTLVYRLPFNLADVDHFNLLLQKQIGSLPADFSYKLNFPARQLLWQSFDPTDLQTDGFDYNFSLNGDCLLGEVLRKY